MRHLNRLIFFIFLSLLLPINTYAGEVNGHSSNVFKFQEKLANKGNARAQYKLACMYENGVGIERDIKQAKHWYSMASDAGVKAASDRMTYLSIKQQGYDKARDAEWLDGIKKDAKTSKGDAMFLLAQLYREGIGVKKDLAKSLSILDQVSLLGAADVEDEVALIQQEVATNKKVERAARKKRIEKAQLAQQKKEQKIALVTKMERQEVNKAQPNKELQLVKQAEKEKIAQQAIHEEKIKRYKKAMLALKLEQQKIDEQQAWAAGGDLESVDDEI